MLGQPVGGFHLAATGFENSAQSLGTGARTYEALTRSPELLLGHTSILFRSPRILKGAHVRGFDKSPISGGAAAAVVSQRASGRFVDRGCRLDGQALGLRQGHARAILVHFPYPYSRVETGLGAHNILNRNESKGTEPP